MVHTRGIMNQTLHTVIALSFYLCRVISLQLDLLTLFFKKSQRKKKTKYILKHKFSFCLSRTDVNKRHLTLVKRAHLSADRCPQVNQTPPPLASHHLAFKLLPSSQTSILNVLLWGSVNVNHCLKAANVTFLTTLLVLDAPTFICKNRKSELRGIYYGRCSQT